MSDEKPPDPGELVADYMRRITAAHGAVRVPTPTAETQTLGLEGKKVVQKARAWAQALGILVAALAAATPFVVTAYRSLAEEARVRAQAAKQLAEDGYQVTKEALQADRAAKAQLEKRVAELEQALRAGTPDPHRRLRGALARRPPPVVAAVPVPRALPGNLDQAQRQLARKATAPEPPVSPHD